jgi:hypothetical protein
VRIVRTPRLSCGARSSRTNSTRSAGSSEASRAGPLAAKVLQFIRLFLPRGGDRSQQRRLAFERAKLSSIGGVAFAFVLFLGHITAWPAAGLDLTNILLIAGGFGLAGVVTGFVWTRHIWTKCLVTGLFRRKVSFGWSLFFSLAIAVGFQAVARFLPSELLLATVYSAAAFATSFGFGPTLFERTTRLRIWLSSFPSRWSPQWIEYRVEKLSTDHEAA